MYGDTAAGRKRVAQLREQGGDIRALYDAKAHGRQKVVCAGTAALTGEKPPAQMVPPVRLVCPECPQVIATVLDRALLPDPGDRYPSIVGLEKSKSIASKLTANAFKALQPFRGQAVALESLAKYLLERDR